VRKKKKAPALIEKVKCVTAARCRNKVVMRNQGNMALSTLDLVAHNKGSVLVAAVANTASLLFGYDTGVAGSVVALQRFVSHTSLPWQSGNAFY
jgi:hypothetical protein